MANDVQDWSTGQPVNLGKTGSAGAGTNTQTVQLTGAVTALMVLAVDLGSTLRVTGVTSGLDYRDTNTLESAPVIIPVAPSVDSSVTLSLVSLANTTMQVIAMYLPLPPTNTTEALGAQYNTPITDATQNGSMISWLKGIVKQLTSVINPAGLGGGVQALNVVGGQGDGSVLSGANTPVLVGYVDHGGTVRMVRGTTTPLPVRLDDGTNQITLDAVNGEEVVPAKAYLTDVNGHVISTVQTHDASDQYWSSVPPMGNGCNVVVANNGVILAAPGPSPSYLRYCITAVHSTGAGAADSWTLNGIRRSGMNFPSGVGNGGTQVSSLGSGLLSNINTAVTYNAINVNQNLRIGICYQFVNLQD